MRHASGHGLARFLGYFSIGLGLTELLAPRALARFTGVHHENVSQLYGMREAVCGVGILNSNDPTEWIWARVAGDALDVATAMGNLAEARG